MLFRSGSIEDFDDCYEDHIRTFEVEGQQDPPENLLTDVNDPAQIRQAGIAQSMWDDYIMVLQEQGHTADDYLYNDEDEEEEEEDGDN